MDRQTHSHNTPVNQGHFRKSDNTVASPTTPLPMPPSSSYYTADSGRGHSGKKGACFLCKEEGHWARECPNSRSRSRSKNSPRLRSKCYPAKMCKCGLTCVVRTSMTPKNPNRDFYCCPKSGDEKCKSFMGWCDEARNSGQADRSDQYPICDCRAGKGRLMTVQDGELAGCQYFVCMLKELFRHTDDARCTRGCPSHRRKPPQQAGPSNKYPTCDCRAGKGQLMTVQDGELPGCQYFVCILKEGHGRCNFFEWYTSPPLNFERKNDCDGENKRPQCNLHVEGPKSPQIVDWGNIEERTRFRSDEMVAPVVLAARREQGTGSVGSGLSPLNWRTTDRDTRSGETLVPASPLLTRRKLDFDEAISGFTPNVCRASPLKGKERCWTSDSAAFGPSPSFKDGFAETVAPASMPLSPREFQHTMCELGSSTIDMPTPHVSVDID